MAPLKVDEYGDFVLKLKIKADDGSSQIRRTRLPRITDVTGSVSYEELVDLVVTFTFPAASSSNNFDCTLTYFDEDEDTITIASTTELVDAIEQFVDKKVLRISTEVKRKTSPAQPTPPTPQPSSGSTDRGTSTNSGDLDANIQNVLESFVGVLVNAVSSLEDGISAVPSNGAEATPRSAATTTNVPPKASAASSGRKPESSDDAKPAAEPDSPTEPAPKISTPTQPASKPAAMNIEMPYIHRRHTCDACLMNPIVGPRYHAVSLIDYDLCENCFPKYSGEETDFILYPSNERVVRSTCPPNLTPQETKPAAAPQPEPATTPAPSPLAQPEEETIPFIHGRHTCDSCLMTPIIGKRYHATNMKNYDLCERCHANYQGTEILFEVVELPRDRAFQKRWNRRRNRMEKMKMRRCGRSGHGCNRAIPRTTPAEPAPQTDHVSPQIEQESTARAIPNQTSAPAAEAYDDFDGALKEAIRRSLEDVMPKEATESTDPIVLPSAPAEEAVPPAPTEEAVPSAPTEEEVLNLPTPGITDPVTVEDSNPNANELEVVESIGIVESESPVNSIVEVDEQRLLESMEETMSVDSEMMTSDDNDFDTKPVAVDRETSMSTPERQVKNIELPSGTATDESFAVDAPVAVYRETSMLTPEREVKNIEQAKSPGTATDESFALDAIGSGDIAEAMGATLDMVAGVISEMLTEADVHNSPTEIVDGIVEASLATKPEVVVDEAVEEEVTEGQIEVDCAESIETGGTPDSGALIMDFAPEDPHEEVDEWQVVDDNANEVSDMANATQMLGSALFNSEMQSSTMGNSDAFSAASTVPSDVPSISTGTEVSYVCATQRDRWASQLYMLSEMGFDDEEKCVETLERLQAANIGCGEESEVSVTQVVEEMFMEQK